MLRRLKDAVLTGETPVTHAGIVGQVWSGGSRQALLSRALSGIEVVPLDQLVARRAGELLGTSGTADVIDAALAVIASDGDRIVTSDPRDLSRLVEATGRNVEIVRA